MGRTTDNNIPRKVLPKSDTRATCCVCTTAGSYVLTVTDLWYPSHEDASAGLPTGSPGLSCRERSELPSQLAYEGLLGKRGVPAPQWAAPPRPAGNQHSHEGRPWCLCLTDGETQAGLSRNLAHPTRSAQSHLAGLTPEPALSVTQNSSSLRPSTGPSRKCPEGWFLHTYISYVLVCRWAT